MSHNPEFTKDYVNQLAQAVVSTRIRGGIPNNFTFNPNSGKLLFLSSNFTSNLYYVNLEDINNNTTGEIETLSPQLVLRSDSLGGDHKFSKEEQLLRERQRLTETGITTYFPTDNGEKILIPIGNQLCIAERKEKENHFAMEHVFQSNGTMDPKWSHDGNLISFVRNDDIWILDLKSKAEHQITTVHAENNLRSAGSSKFIMQEEFDRYTGYWWSPVADKEYNILYLVEDEEGVSLFGIPRPGYSGEIDNYSYPLAGEKNTTFEVWVASFSLSSSSSSSSSSISVKRTNIFPQLQESFSWCEYIVRAGWMPSGKSVWVQLVDRKQQHIALVELHLDLSIAPKILFEEFSDVWINVTDIIHIFDDNRIIWASEITGYRHLYMLTPSPNGPHTATPITSLSPPSLSPLSSPSFSSSSSSLSFSSSSSHSSSSHHSSSLSPSPSSISSHPPSEWESAWSLMRDPQIVVDEKRSLIFFLATRDSPLESHFYVASYAPGSKPSEVIRLTPLGASHTEVTMSPDCTTFVAKSSSLSVQPQTTIFKLKFENSQKFPSAAPVARIASSLPANPFPANPPNIFSFNNKNGVKLFGCYFLPPNYNPALKYRTLVRIYGGPHVQLVTNSYEVTNQPEIQMYLALGFICVIIDNTGSNNRGLHFEGLLRNKMGTIEISDQVDGIEYLISQGIGIDKNRIGVTGWSYGGYLSLMALCQRPDIFKVAIPKCPVVLWEAYDTGYTERYMDVPPTSGYTSGSVLTYINTFPDDDNRLLLVHGLQDENVHFSNTVLLIDSLIAANKPHQTLLLPKERHGCANSNTRRYLLVQCAQFFLKNM